jgi:predicted enzyme related to lactoylglutathione lyase
MTKLKGMQPVLAVGVLSENLSYYREQLGFTVSWQWGEPAVRAGVARDGLELQLVSDGRFSPECPSRIYFLVADVDAYHAECEARGAEIQMALADRPSFGMRDFRVVDRSGNVLAFGEPIEVQ